MAMNHPEVRVSALGDDVSSAELSELQRVDTLLRWLPAPVARVPDTLTRRVLALPDEPGRRGGRSVKRRLAAVLSVLLPLRSW